MLLQAIGTAITCFWSVYDVCMDVPYNFLYQYSVHRLLIHHWVLGNDFLNVDGVGNLLHNPCHDLLDYLRERKSFTLTFHKFFFFFLLCPILYVLTLNILEWGKTHISDIILDTLSMSSQTFGWGAKGDPKGDSIPPLWLCPHWRRLWAAVGVQHPTGRTSRSGQSWCLRCRAGRRSLACR